MPSPPPVDQVPDPVRASALADLERANGFGVESPPHPTAPNRLGKGIQIPGLDGRLADVWQGGRVVGVGTVEVGDEMLLLHLMASALACRLSSAQIQRLPSFTDAHDASPYIDSISLPKIHVIAPHTSQTIPLLHASLARTLGHSGVAMDLLQNVRLLQYFDLAGLIESVAEVQEQKYQQRQQFSTSAAQSVDYPPIPTLRDIVVIQGIAPALSLLYRRSGLVHTNGLLAGLLRTVTQLSRTSTELLVLVDAPMEVGVAVERQHHTAPAGPGTRRVLPATLIDSAFSNIQGHTLRLVLGHESFSRALEGGLDCLVVVHDAFGRARETKTSSVGVDTTVVEVVKDRVGGMIGMWSVWERVLAG